jgi:hypothetical protein
MMSEENKTDRKVIHTKDSIFDTYVNVLLLMIENKGKSFMNSEIREKLFDDPTNTSVKSMVKRVVDFYVGSSIFVKVTEITDNNGNMVELKPNQYRIRLYDKDIDRITKIDKDGNEIDDDYYNVHLHIPKSRDGRERFCQTVSSMITQIPNVDIYTPTLKTVLESQIFGFHTYFVSQTIGKVVVKHHNIQNMSDKTNGYPLDVIMSIIDSQINVNVKFENFGNTIELNNTKIKKVTIKENGFDIHFDNFISQNQSDIKQILSIENSSEDGLRDDIEKVREMINDLPSEEKEKITKLIGEVTPSMDIFEF